MSVENPYATATTHRPGEDSHDSDIGAIAARVSEWLGEGEPPEQPEALDDAPRRRAVVAPSATRIGHTDETHPFPCADDPATDDRESRLRRLHEELDARLEGNETRRDRLDIARITQAVCNTLDVTPWERDRVLGVVSELDETVFTDGHTVPRVALVVAQRVVDIERRAWLGVEDCEDPPQRLERLQDRITHLADCEGYETLRTDCGMRPAVRSELETTLDAELDEATVREATFGRSLYRDPALPSFEHDG